MEPFAFQSPAWQHNSVKMEQLLQHVGIDPNDPRNEGLLELLQWRNAEQSGLTGMKICCLDPSDNLRLQYQSRAPLKRARFLKDRWSAFGIVKEGWISTPKLDSTATPLSNRDAMNEGTYSESLHLMKKLLLYETDKTENFQDSLLERQGTTLRLAEGIIRLEVCV